MDWTKIRVTVIKQHPQMQNTTDYIVAFMCFRVANKHFPLHLLVRLSIKPYFMVHCLDLHRLKEQILGNQEVKGQSVNLTYEEWCMWMQQAAVPTNFQHFFL